MMCCYLNVHFQGQRVNVLNIPYVKLTRIHSAKLEEQWNCSKCF